MVTKPLNKILKHFVSIFAVSCKLLGYKAIE